MRRCLVLNKTSSVYFNASCGTTSREQVNIAKHRLSSQILVTDGADGMRPIVDLRFDVGEWPIKHVVVAKNADTWMAHLDAEVEERNWNSSAFSQLDVTENSGTLILYTEQGPKSAALDITWEKQRNKELHVRARPGGDPVLSLEIARDFFSCIDERAKANTTISEYRQGFLTYDGLAWRGELWLDAHHRLGPPSKYPDTLHGPQIIVLDTIVSGIGPNGVNSNFLSRLNEIRVFLGFVLGLNVKFPRYGYEWQPEIDSQGNVIDCKLQRIGYFEPIATHTLPKAGSVGPLRSTAVERPGLGPYLTDSNINEQCIPCDIEQLWETFVRLPNLKRDQLIRAGNAFLIACSMSPDQRSAYAAFLVVACESLKPSGKKFDGLNIYDVVENLLNKEEADRLRELAVRPHKVRNGLLHRAELAAGELVPMVIHDHFRDPSFDEMINSLSMITRMCLIEWLRCEGKYNVVLPSKPKRKC